MEIKAGKEYRIMSSSVGPKGSSVGRKCRTNYKHGGPPHTLWGDIWNVSTIDGKPFVSEVGIGDSCDVAADWLEDADTPTNPNILKKELEVS